MPKRTAREYGAPAKAPGSAKNAPVAAGKTGTGRRPEGLPLLDLPVRRPFHLGFMVLSHGWSDLPPFRWAREEACLHMAVRTGPDRAFGLKIEGHPKGPRSLSLRVHQTAGTRPGKRDLARIAERVRFSFRLDEDFAEFQERCAAVPHLAFVNRYGLGPFLRNPDPFEEFAKVLLTTNINWAGTRNLVRNLLEHLGTPLRALPARGAAAALPLIAFPGPETIAACSERFLREKIRLGYRAPFLKELAESFLSGRIDAAAFEDPALPLADLARALGAIKGFGPYAVESLLVTYGRFERIILDSWVRKRVRLRHFKGRKVGDASLRKVYAPWGRFAGLACWFECALDTWIADELAGSGRGVIVPR